jgi:hypothetical protein
MLLCSFFWVIPRSLIFYVPKFRDTVFSIFIGGLTSFRWVQVIFEPNLYLYKYPNNLVPVILPAYKMEQTECSETSAHKIQTPGYHPKDRIKHSEHGEV